MKQEIRDCLILDIKEYSHGIISKKDLCSCISKHLNVICMPYCEFILQTVFEVVIIYIIIKFLII